MFPDEFVWRKATLCACQRFWEWIKDHFNIYEIYLTQVWTASFLSYLSLTLELFFYLIVKKKKKKTRRRRRNDQTTLPVSWEICMQVKKQQLEPDMEWLVQSWERSTIRLFIVIRLI